MEEIEIEPTYYNNLAILQIEMNNVIDKYENSNYNLSMVTSGGVLFTAGAGILVTTYLFKKE